MSNIILVALLYSVIAGVMNGSFALPTKHIKTWNFEHIWLNYSSWAFLILPWLTVFVLDPQIAQVYQAMTPQTGFILLIGGFLFGAGQVCFAFALNFIGLGLGFLINIGLGTALGFSLPLVTLHSDKIFSATGLTSLVGIFLLIISLIISYRAGQQRDRQKQDHQTNQIIKKSTYSLGVLLAVLAGFFSAGQNYTFALTTAMQQTALASGTDPLVASIVIWPPFLTCSFIPYALYMLYLHHKNHSFRTYFQPQLLRNSIFGIVMGLFWFGSLIIYSKVSLMIGSLGPVVAWPLFMALIILTSNFWGWRHKEWAECQLTVKRNALLAMGILVVAVLILAYSANLSLATR